MKIRVYWAYPDLFEIRHTYQDIPLPSNYVLTEEKIKQVKQKAAKFFLDHSGWMYKKNTMKL